MKKTKCFIVVCMSIKYLFSFRVLYSFLGYERETSVHFLSPFVLHWIFCYWRDKRKAGEGTCYKRMRQTRLGAIKVKNQLRTSSSKAITVSTLWGEHRLYNAFIYKWCGIDFFAYNIVWKADYARLQRSSRHSIAFTLPVKLTPTACNRTTNRLQ